MRDPMCTCGHRLDDHIFGQLCRFCECREARLTEDQSPAIVRKTNDGQPAKPARRRRKSK